MSAPENIDDLIKLRHSLAHVLAQAVLNLYPKTKYAIGPPVDFGCYYDFLFEEPISEEEFPVIEEEMRRIIGERQRFRRDDLPCADAKEFWRGRGQLFKVEMIEDLEKDEGVRTVSHYVNVSPKGEERFTDLCRGGHREHLGEIPADSWKLLSVAGAYWRSDEAREQLTRVYVAAFPTKAELDRYLSMREEAAKYDHRHLGRELGIFVISEAVGPGLPMLAPNGAVIRRVLEDWIRGELERRGYSFTYTPQIGRKALYERSGHLSHFRESIFPLMEAEDAEYVLRPMNCPHHVEVFRSVPRSYRDLPVRLAEFGTVYRYEKSGQVGGLTRVRGFTQDDAHLFMRSDQMQEEITGILDLAFLIYRTLGFTEFTLRLSLRDPGDMRKYIGSPENWDKAEAALRAALDAMKLPYVESVGEAAFYGPKIDLIVKDVFGREWQLGTIPQVDYNMPERFDLTYTDRDGSARRPVMMHRAVFGSFERFIGVLIEHFRGLFPLWLAPVQAALLPVAAPHEEYAREVQGLLRAQGVRTVALDHTESLGRRIREGETRRIPYLLVLGDKEAQSRSVAVRNVKTKRQVTVGLGEFVERTLENIRERSLEAAIS